MGQDEIPSFIGVTIAAVVLGAMVMAGIVIVAVFSLL